MEKYMIGGGCRCSFKDCQNTTRISEHVNFFHYPVKNRQRCMKWIENAQKPHFYDYGEDQLKNKVICHEHFEDRWFANNLRKRLLPGAVPTLDKGRPFEKFTREPFKLTSGVKSTTQTGFKSNQYKDVQVLPTNDDKTVFYLDAENMFTESHKIESYVIKNGQLVRSISTPRPLPKASKTRVNPHIFKAYQDKFNLPPPAPSPPRPAERTVDEPPVKMIKKEPVREQSVKEVTIKKEIIDPIDPLECANNTSSQTTQPNQIAEEYQDFESIEVHLQTDGPQESKTAVEKSYLKKIKQHSKEIATIKRMLAKKKLTIEKPDLSTAFGVVEEKLPTTITTIISLLLGLKNDLNEADVEFFTTLHRTSPDAYQLLSDKYGWNLPSVDIVETDE